MVYIEISGWSPMALWPGRILLGNPFRNWTFRSSGQKSGKAILDPISLELYLPWAAWRCSGRRDPPKLGPSILASVPLKITADRDIYIYISIFSYPTSPMESTLIIFDPNISRCRWKKRLLIQCSWTKLRETEDKWANTSRYWCVFALQPHFRVFVQKPHFQRSAHGIKDPAENCDLKVDWKPWHLARSSSKFFKAVLFQLEFWGSRYSQFCISIHMGASHKILLSIVPWPHGPLVSPWKIMKNDHLRAASDQEWWP